jgi:hypothetical protein
MGASRGLYRVLVGKPEGKKLLERPRRRWDDIIKMAFQEVERMGKDWNDLAQDRDRWRAFGNKVMRRISWLAENRLASHEGLCSMQ